MTLSFKWHLRHLNLCLSFPIPQMEEEGGKKKLYCLPFQGSHEAQVKYKPFLDK